MPRAAMENADLARIINSNEVQSVLKPKLEAPKTHEPKRNALKNKEVMDALNPGALKRKAALQKSSEKGTSEFKEVQDKKKARQTESKEHNKKHKKGEDTFYKTLMKPFEAKAAEAAAKKAEEEDATQEDDE